MINLFSKLSTRMIGGLVLSVALAVVLFWLFGAYKSPKGSLHRPEGATGAMPVAPGSNAVAPAAGVLPPSANLDGAIQRIAAKVNANPLPPLKTRTSWQGMSFTEADAAFAAAASAANVKTSVVSPFGALEP